MVAAAQTTEAVRLKAVASSSHETSAVAGNGGMADVTIEFILKKSDTGDLTSARADFRVAYALNDAETLVNMHGHTGGEGENGGAAVGSSFGGAVQAGPGTGVLFRSMEVTDPATLGSVMAILANPHKYYFNLHSQSNPGGIMRGQLMPVFSEIGGDLAGDLHHFACSYQGLRDRQRAPHPVDWLHPHLPAEKRARRAESPQEDPLCHAVVAGDDEVDIVLRHLVADLNSPDVAALQVHDDHRRLAAIRRPQFGRQITDEAGEPQGEHGGEVTEVQVTAQGAPDGGRDRMNPLGGQEEALSGGSGWASLAAAKHAALH
jgi:hypothetical protein